MNLPRMDQHAKNAEERNSRVAATVAAMEGQVVPDPVPVAAGHPDRRRGTFPKDKWHALVNQLARCSTQAARSTR